MSNRPSSITEITRRVDDAAEKAIALSAQPQPSNEWPQREHVSAHETRLVYFDCEIESHGRVVIRTTREGLEIWVNGERWQRSEAGK